MKKIVLALLLALGIFLALESSQAETIFEFTSDPGNSIGQGESFSSADLPDAYGWSVQAKPDNDQSLQVGSYENAQYLMDSTTPDRLILISMIGIGPVCPACMDIWPITSMDPFRIPCRFRNQFYYSDLELSVFSFFGKN